MKTANDKKEIFEKMPVPTALKIMAVPAIMSQLIVLIYNMADTFYLGRTGDPFKVAGISMILPIFNITVALTGLAGVGGGTLISRLLGEGRENEAKKAGTFTIYLALLMAAILSVAMAVFMEPILIFLGASENTVLYAKQYTWCVIVLGGIPTVMSNVFSYLLRSIGYSKQASLGVAMGGILNIFFDPLFMFVLLPAGYEVLGVGIATCLSNCIACTYFLILMYKTRKEHIISFDIRIGLPEKKNIRAVFNVGIPSSVAILLFDLDYIILDKLMVAYGDIALAAVGIVLKIERLPLNIGIGICQGMVPLAAYNFSANNVERREAIVRYARKVGLIVGFLSICLYEVAALWMLRFFIPEPETILLGSAFLRIRILATPFMFLCFFTVDTFNAYGEGRKALFLGVTRWAVINIPMLFVMNAVFGMYGLVWSQLVSDLTMAMISLWVYRRYYCYRNERHFSHGK